LITHKIEKPHINKISTLVIKAFTTEILWFDESIVTSEWCHSRTMSVQGMVG